MRTSFQHIQRPLKIWLVALWGMQLMAFLWALWTGHFLTKDSLEYLAAAKHFWSEGLIYAGNGSELDFRLLSKRPPVYPVLLSFFTLGGAFIWPMLMVQNIGLAWTYLYLAKAFNSTFNRQFKAWAVLIATLFIFTPIIYANMLMSDIWLVFCLVPATVWFGKFVVHHNRKKGVHALLLLLIAAMLKPVALYLLAAYAFLWTGLSIRKRQYKPLLFLVIPVVTIGAWTVRNAIWTSVQHYSSIYNINLSQYNARLFLASKTSHAYADSVLKPTFFVPNSRKEFERYDRVTRELGSKIIYEDPIGYAWFHFKGMVKMPLDPGRFDLSSFFHGLDDGGGFLTVNGGVKEKLTWLGSHQPFVGVFWVFGFVARVALLLLLMTSLLQWKKFEVQHWLYLAIILYFVTVTGPLGASRFYLPALPFVFLLSFRIISVPKSS